MKKRRIIEILATVLIFALLLSACGNGSGKASVSTQTPDSAQSSKSENSEITITDLDGKTYTFDKPLDSVIIQWSCSGGPFMTMSALFGKDVYKHIAAMDDDIQKNRMDMYEQFCKNVPELANVLVAGNMDSDDFNLEAAISSGAEAAIIPIGLKEAVKESVQPKLEAAGIPVIYIDYHAETIENHTKSTQILGALFGKEERAQELIDFYTSHVETVYNKVAEILKTKERPTVYIEGAYKSPEEYGNSYPNDFMWGGMCYNVGAYSIATDVLKESSAGALEAEYVLSSNPDKIIFTGSYWPAAPKSIRMGFQASEEQTRELISAYLDRPGWRELDAVKNGEVYVVHHSIGREMFDCASMEALAKIVFPDEFADLDPTATLREYYNTFLPYDLAGLWYMKY